MRSISGRSSGVVPPSTSWTYMVAPWIRGSHHDAGGTAGRPRGAPPNLPLVQEHVQATLERGGHRHTDRPRLEALDQLGHEALDHQALGDRVVQAARPQVEDLLRVDLGDRRG